MYRGSRAKVGWLFAFLSGVRWIADQWSRGEVMREWIEKFPRWLHFLNERWVIPLILVVGIGLIVWAALDHGSTVGFDNWRWLPSRYRNKRVPHEYIVGIPIIAAIFLVGILLHHAESKRIDNQVQDIHHVTLTMPPRGWLLEWGESIPQNTVRSVADVTTIIPYRSHFHLLLVYRLADNTVDEQDDSKIIKSGLFSVTEDSRLVMDTQLSQAFLDNAVADKSAGVVVIPMRVILLILPTSIGPEKISKISDAARFGGAVLTTNGFGLPTEKKILRRPRAPLP